jgi:cytochrome c-type biogenesis protein CcsB
MIIYWIQASNFEFLNSKNQNLIISGSIAMIISNLSLFILLISRWYNSGHFPLSNLYESLMFLSWSLTLIHLIIQAFLGLFPINLEYFFQFKTISQQLINKSSTSLVEHSKRKKTEIIASFDTILIPNSEISIGNQKQKILINKLIGSITAPCALFTNAFATFSLPKEMQDASPLVPALQSNWLMMHVTVMILSYAALILGSLVSIGFLVISSSIDSKFFLKNINKTIDNSNDKILSSDINNQLSFNLNLSTYNFPIDSDFKTNSTFYTKQEKKFFLDKENRFNLAKILDNLSYRILGLGFPLLTIGILSGAVWANEAWGSYWSWDPKETWALLTWFVFAIYLHTRLTKGWQGKKPALIASLGFVVVWVCFLGVNLIGEGLHSYGWLS